MSTIFKTKIVPNLNTASLEASEALSLIHILELMNATDNEAYKAAKITGNAQNITSNFSQRLTEQIYYHPTIYADEKEGLEFIASWLPILEQGCFPDKKSADKLVEFLKFSLGYFQSQAIADTYKNQIFKVLKALVQSESEASLPVARFLIQNVFDIRDYLSSDFLIQNCLKHTILCGSYTVVSPTKEITSFPFKINHDFIEHFYEGDWYQLITIIHQILPVGRVYAPGAYHVLLAWFSTDLAKFYADNLELAFAAHSAIKERLIFGEAESLELLNIKTAEGVYPLITALGAKKWDAGDVLLFNNRDKAIPQVQVDACYLRLIDWLSANGGGNFNSEAFQEYGKHILSDNNIAALPVDSIAFWFEKCHSKSGNSSQIEFYNNLFSGFLSEFKNGKFPVMRLKNEAFQVTGEYVIKEVFKNLNNIGPWLESFKSTGLKDPLNQFIVLSYYDARTSLLDLYSEESRQVLHTYLLDLAYSSRNASENIRKEGLALIVNILASLWGTPANYTRVNEIWAFKSIDSSVTKLCNDFAKEQYLNEKRSLSLKLIQAWYNFLGDYYYSATTEAVWVGEMLQMQGIRSANYFNTVQDDMSFFLDRTVSRLLHFHKKCKSSNNTNDVLSLIATQIETYLSDFLQELNEDKLAKPTVKYLSDYSKNEVFGFSTNTDLLNAIIEFYDFHFKQEPIIESKVVVEQSKPAETTINEVNIDKNYVETVLSNLENYKTTGSCDTQLLAVLDERVSELKTSYKQDDTGLEARFNQALYMALLDKDLAPGTTLETYGNLCRSLFIELVKGSKMASSYALGLKTMANSGAYPEHLKTALLQVMEDLNA
ncbi:hypothetical protein [uncultured Salegentibacter sp.]|uniref:hypothetical protein n=1 Tax=uncultured Salegentibacter sp. TaxID=259320 RepID=UPI0025987FDD|nr:hypothetical protein [uncultured Salegentibacter sp.]